MMRQSTRRGLSALALLCCLLLSACGGGSSAKPFDPASAAQALLDSSAFSEPLEEMEQDLACGVLYQIDSETVTGCAVYTSLTAGAEEIAVFTLSDEKNAESALAALKQRVADQTEALENYQPEELDKLSNAILMQRGNSVLLAVSADPVEAQKVIDGFK